MLLMGALTKTKINRNNKMKRNFKLSLSALLVGSAIAAASGNVSAYNLYDQDGTELNLDIELALGIFSSQERYNTLGNTKSGKAIWQEGYINYGFSGSQALGSTSLYGALNLVSSGTWGDGDAAGFTKGNESKTTLEEAYLGWRSGDLIPVLGEDGLDISAGRQNLMIGDGFLINGDALNHSDRGGAYWLAARKVFDNTAIIRVGGSEGIRGDLFWLSSDNEFQSEMELAGINAEYVMSEGTIGATYIKGLDVANGGDIERDGQQTISLRYQGDAGVENLFLSTEFVSQESGDTKTSTNAWYVEAGWTFADVLWTPSVNYRYSSFEEGFDPIFFGFSRGYGTWFQGEVASNYAGPFNSGTDVHNITLMAAPSEMMSVGISFFDFSGTSGGTLDGQEIDIYAEWVVTPNLILSPLLGIYTPDKSDINGGSQLGNNDTSIYGQLMAIVPF